MIEARALTTQNRTETIQSPRVLIVEDSKDLAVLWERLFKAKGYVVQYCLEARAALARMAEGQTFDVIVSDYFLPDMNGLALLERVREIDPEIPFLLVTGAREPSVQDTLAQRGNTDFLNKPVKFGLLEEKLRRLISE